MCSSCHQSGLQLFVHYMIKQEGLYTICNAQRPDLSENRFDCIGPNAWRTAISILALLLTL